MSNDLYRSLNYATNKDYGPRLDTFLFGVASGHVSHYDLSNSQPTNRGRRAVANDYHRYLFLRFVWPNSYLLFSPISPFLRRLLVFQTRSIRLARRSN